MTNLLLFQFIRLLLETLQLLNKCMSFDNAAPPLPLLSSTSAFASAAVDVAASHTVGHTHSFDIGGYGTYTQTSTNDNNSMTVRRIGTHTHLNASEAEQNVDIATALVDTFCEYAVRTCCAYVHRVWAVTPFALFCSALFLLLPSLLVLSNDDRSRMHDIISYHIMSYDIYHIT